MTVFSGLGLSFRKNAILEWEVRNVQAFLDEFGRTSGGSPRVARLGRTGEILIVNNFPLPDRYRPDEIDLFVGVSDYPAQPPIGIYVLNRRNEALVAQIQKRTNAFRDKAFHEADAVPGYTWICYAYADNRWRFNASNPSRGDNVRKFLANFFAILEN
jgi:hypothetical protein